MRRLLLLIAGVGLLSAATGCTIVTGGCDCVDLPPPVVPPPPIHPVAHGHPAEPGHPHPGFGMPTNPGVSPIPTTVPNAPEQLQIMPGPGTANGPAVPK